MGLRLICSKVFNRILMVDISKVIDGFQKVFEEHINKSIADSEVT